MNAVLMLTTVLATGMVLTAAAEAQEATHASSDKVAAAFAKGGPIAESEGLVVHVTRRVETAGSERHANTTHVFYIVDGEAIFVTGGKMVGAKETNPGELRGSEIAGGKVNHLKKGDVITVPAGTPHMWKELPTKLIMYYAVNYQK